MKTSTAVALVRNHLIPHITCIPRWLRGAQPPQLMYDQGGYQVVCHRSWPTDACVLGQWDELAARVPTATAFQTHDWQRPLMQRDLRLGGMRLLTVLHKNQALAVFPLRKRRERFESVGALISDYLDPLVDPAAFEPSWRAVLSALRQASRPLLLHNVRCDTPGQEMLRQIAHDEGFHLDEEHCGTVARVTLPATWDDYLKTLSSHDRKECKRKLKKAESQAAAALDTCPADGDPSDRLKLIFDCMEAAGGAKALKARWMYRQIFRSATAGLMRRRILRVQTLMLNGAPGAGIISFRSHSGPLAWAAAYEQSQQNWSPGIVSFAMAIRESIASGERCFDFLRGDQRYKYELGAIDYPLLRRQHFAPRKAA